MRQNFSCLIFGILLSSLYRYLAELFKRLLDFEASLACSGAGSLVVLTGNRDF